MRTIICVNHSRCLGILLNITTQRTDQVYIIETRDSHGRLSPLSSDHAGLEECHSHQIRLAKKKIKLDLPSRYIYMIVTHCSCMRKDLGRQAGEQTRQTAIDRLRHQSIAENQTKQTPAPSRVGTRRSGLIAAPVADSVQHRDQIRCNSCEQSLCTAHHVAIVGSSHAILGRRGTTARPLSPMPIPPSDHHHRSPPGARITAPVQHPEPEKGALRSAPGSQGGRVPAACLPVSAARR